MVGGRGLARRVFILPEGCRRLSESQDRRVSTWGLTLPPEYDDDAPRPGWALSMFERKWPSSV